jgi:spectrin alpha
LLLNLLFQRKHEGVERDLAALEDKVTTLGQEADRLCGIHADHADQIQAKRAEIVEYWESLTTKAKVHFLYFGV